MPPTQEATLPATRRARKSTSSFSPAKTTDKENATIDIGASSGFASTTAASRKKSRSKSMGPGGLDALKSTSGNRRVSLAAPSRPPPRSILKPTMPVLPDIPPLKPKGKGKDASSRNGSPVRGASEKVALRTEEEQQAAAREREREERERAAREKEVNDHREARRKSLANRRVSFAAEATLHTFHEVEYMQDSTTSTDSTARRASSIAAPSPAPSAPQMSDNTFEPPSTPPEQTEENVLSGASPAQQRKRRRSSTGVGALGFRSPTVGTGDDNSTVYDSDGDEVEEDDGENDLEDVDSDSADNDSDEGDGATMVTVDADETTSASVMSAVSMRSASPIESTSDLDDALRLATQHAGAQADETRRQRPVDEDEEVIPAFAGWGKKAGGATAAAPVQASQQLQEQQQSPSGQSQRDEDTAMSMDMSMGMDMDMTSAMGGIIRPTQSRSEEEMSMDVTRVYGGIIAQSAAAADIDSVASSPMIIPDDTIVGDMPMELTTAMGVIRSVQEADTESVDNEALEDMSMELTTVMGGVLGASSFGANLQRRLSRRQSTRGANTGEEDGDVSMDMTVSAGNIFTSNNAALESNDGEDGEEEMEDATIGMDITTALGGILKPASPTRTRAMAQQPDPSAGPATSQTPTKASLRSSSPPKTATKASPGLSAFRGKGLHRTPARGEISGNKEQQTKNESTLSTKQPTLTTQAVATSAPSTPKRSSPVREFIGSRSKSPKTASPKRNASPAEKSTTPRSPPKTAPRAQSLFTQNPATGATAPSVILTPQGRRPRQSAYTGAGQPASPKIAEIFSRRSSLVDSAADFVVGSAQKDRPAVTFEEPSRHSTPEDVGASASGPQDDREATQNLKDLIQNLSPKKNPLRGRKSLHVGSAKGLLGKRPFELDEDDENDSELESQEFVKRLKSGPEPSPVKNVRLQQPPSVMETIGRSSRSRRSPSATPLLLDLQNTPRRSAESDAAKDNTTSLNIDTGIAEPIDNSEERIHLQDFLNLANIHFMELETTKRRPTELPSSFKDDGGPRLSTDEDGQPKDPEIESLVTSVCKVPLLEMYQHACRELKNYIEEGRSIMREIEAETYEDNPPIFREYTAATPEMRAQMDTQFKNIKIFARLQSKKQWYEWRTKLQEGLQEGMLKTLRDLEKDQEVLQRRREKVDAVYPALLAEYEALERERLQLEKFAQQLGGDDRDALIAARQQKRHLQVTMEERKGETARLEAEMRASKARVTAMKTEREQYLKELEEAKRIQEERRSWSHQEISSLKTQVDALEKKSGWAVTGAQGTTLSLAYRREIELVLDVASFAPGQPNTRIDLWYIGHTRTRDPGPPYTPEQEFFLQCIRDHVRGLRQADTHPGKLLKVVRASWDTAQQAARQIRHLQLSFPTATRKTSDASIAVDVSVLLVPLQTKVSLTLHLRSLGCGEGTGTGGLKIAVSAESRVVYGEPFNAAKMSEFLSTHVGDRVVKDTSSSHKREQSGNKSKLGASRSGKPVEYWVDIVEELKGKLLARGRK